MAYRARVEAGPWLTVGEQLDGPTVHERLLAARDRSTEGYRPYAVYVHVPFCISICSFCALYTHSAGADAEHRFDEYTDLVVRSLEHHPWLGAPEAPTTVHFGGGTPLVLGTRRFGRLVRALVDAFGTATSCEWAVETTTSSMDAETVAALEDLGFRRIHLGIQTLDDTIRSRVGRHESGARALERIVSLEERGFATSVDLILGLEGVDTAVVEEDLRRLYAAGVRMFSICDLRERGTAAHARTRTDGERAGRQFALWKAVWRFMEEVALVPIHVGQFGRTQADNLYFTHPARGEDCAAIGPYAHGSSGTLAFENRLLPEYYEAVRDGRTPIAMGVDYGASEQILCALERELLTHSVSREVIGRVEDAYSREFAAILGSWFAADLLRPAEDGTSYALTAAGSWFVGNMIAEARRLAEKRAAVK